MTVGKKDSESSAKAEIKAGKGRVFGPIREKFMKYIAEILSDDIVWLINENRRLISIHQTREEADYYCQKHFKMAPVVIDRRVHEKNRNSW